MIDLNTLVSNALIAAVQQAVAPLTARIEGLEQTCAAMRDRIDELEGQAVHARNAVDARIAALETKLTEANLFTQTTNVTIPIDEARMVEALNSQEWFWEKLQSRIDDAAERVMDHHLECYDHDNYDEVASKVDDLPDLDDYVTRDSVREEIEDVLNNATISLRV